MVREIILFPYQEEWEQAFEKEAILIEQIMEENLVELHHIGSTSIEGLAAKPIIDMLLEVKCIVELDGLRVKEKFQHLGYEVKGEWGISGRRYFCKRSKEKRTHHIHAFQIGDLYIDEHLAFRDYLREYPEVREDYEKIKREGAEKHRWDIHGYMEHKDSFIKETQRRALAWYKNPREIFFVFSEDQTLAVYESISAVRRECEGIDVEEGVYAIFNERGEGLSPTFHTPNKKGMFSIVSSQDFSFAKREGADHVEIESYLECTVALEENRFFNDLPAVREFILLRRQGTR